MDGTNPKVSFIPKGSLIREESFLERRRPRSVIGVIAISIFILSIGTYAGLYYYNDLLGQSIAEKTDEIKKAQREFSSTPELNEAKVFRARADLARELLNAHKVVSPVFAFLSKNTTESILYNKFSFKNGADGLVLELSGEAQTYSALAYQADVLQGQTAEISKFSVNDVVLTKLGTITFVLVLEFNPEYLLYISNKSSLTDVTPTPALAIGAPDIVISVPKSTVSTTSTTTLKAVPDYPVEAPSSGGTEVDSTVDSGANSLANDWTVTSRDVATTSAAVKNTEEQSVLRGLWSKFKFW